MNNLTGAIVDALVKAEQAWRWPSAGGADALKLYHEHRATAVIDAIEKHALLETHALFAALQGDITEIKQRVSKMADLDAVIADFTTTMTTVLTQLAGAVSSVGAQIHTETQEILAQLAKPVGNADPAAIDAAANKITFLKNQLNTSVGAMITQLNETVTTAQASIAAAQPAPAAPAAEGNQAAASGEQNTPAEPNPQSPPPPPPPPAA